MNLAIIQARMGSSRLPGKVLRPLVGKPMLLHIVERVAVARSVEQVVVATSDRSGDDAIASACQSAGIACYRGSETDVLDRFWRAAQAFGGTAILRITGDCPFVDPLVIDRLSEVFFAGDLDHVAVATGAGAAKSEGNRWPDGLDAEWMRLEALDRARREATEQLDREHVTPFLWRNKHVFSTDLMFAPADYSHLRWTVDNEDDFEFVRRVYVALYSHDKIFHLDDILTLLKARPELAELNRLNIGHEGYEKLYSLPLSEPSHERG